MSQRIGACTAIYLSGVTGLFQFVNGPAAASEATKIENWSLGGTPAYVYSLDPKAGPAHFNESRPLYDKNPGSITSCKLYIEIPLTRVEVLYGGICTFKGKPHDAEVAICDDTGVGEFAMVRALDGIEPKSALIQFVADHCGGG
jgi:hypothetical protein